MRIFHIATVPDWEAARASGAYTTSTRGRTLAEEGFIHASRGDQWQAVRQRYYADVTEPLVLLVIDPDLLTSPVVVEPAVPGGGQTFPHVYGPIDPAAVVQTIALDPDVTAVPTPVPATTPAPDPATAEPAESFSRVYLREMFRNVAIASGVLLVVVLCTLVGRAVEPEWGPITGALVGFVVGVVAVRLVTRRSLR
ncbi:DUF952 domain-containing protein [Nocardioides sp. C4-1]|uniref:DUF952 domain-containing protein n=1 Tax=Nocardioides sp. C4-1 TaxID=3151851 RepID=UPI003267F3F0